MPKVDELFKFDEGKFTKAESLLNGKYISFYRIFATDCFIFILKYEFGRKLSKTQVFCVVE